MSSTDEQNNAFWNELCGTPIARKLGISDNSPKSIARFDDWYFKFYPYLEKHIPFESLAGKDVLEIGLGFGTVAQRLMAMKANYHGLDVAVGPIEMARHRAKLLNVAVDVRKESALRNPHATETFDYVVSIGCLHHTGNLAQGLREVHRVLKRGGGASIMVYSALSYRQWLSAPIQTVRRLCRPSYDWSNAHEAMRQAYDINLAGVGAPETTYITPREALSFLQPLFQTVKVQLRNMGRDFYPTRLTGRNLGNTLFESWLGLDLYIECVK